MKKYKERDEGFWRLHLDQWKASSMSQAAYCRLYGLKAHQFQYWRRKCSEQAATDLELVQVPFVFRPGSAVTEPARPTAESGIRIRLGGVVVEVSADFDATTLERVMTVLEGRDVA